MVRHAASTFKAPLLRPAENADWSFVIVPKAASDTLPRRGRTSVHGTLNAVPFEARLEPDGNLSHWFKVDRILRERAGVREGNIVTVCITPVDSEPEPQLPEDLRAALNASPDARTTWHATTTLAHVDWIHWLDSAKQSATRRRRVDNACDMLAKGKKRVCCFDVSGHYSKSLSAPEPEDVSSRSVNDSRENRKA